MVNDLTKRFELVQRGTLATLVALHADTTPRGEYVVVISGATDPRPGDRDDDADSEVADDRE